MGDKNCLNCKYEPEWGEESRGEYPKRCGACKFIVDVVFPACYLVNKKSIYRHSDDSGIEHFCKTWEQKS